MKKFSLLTALIVMLTLHSFAQGGWTICNTTGNTGRIDDMVMIDTQTGYAVSSGGQIMKTLDGGDNWSIIRQDSVYHRSVEFVNAQKGFVGSFTTTTSSNILMRTIDGGASWTDLTPLLDTVARSGICGLAIPDSNTIYGCGNWFRDSAYIIKSIDGGNTWSFIDMKMYATHLIDMYFINKDTGFVTGSGPPPLAGAVILYTTNGGQTWTYKFQNTIGPEYCWKIQHLTDQIYFASIQEYTIAPSQILKSTDGGMTWNILIVDTNNNDLQGVGFIDSLLGWTGGGVVASYQTNDGGQTWNLNHICPMMNRLLRVNDTLLFASGNEMWKYNSLASGISPLSGKVDHYAFLNCHPNPVSENLFADVTLTKSNYVLLFLLDNNGKRIKVIDTGLKSKGNYQYQIDIRDLTKGTYLLVMKTHDDQQVEKVIVNH